jgi:beta-xylosidase
MPPPTQTSVPPTATVTLEPSPTPNPLLFRDNFDGAIDSGWQWIRENKKTWNLTNNPGWLEITVGNGNVANGNLDNLLLRQVPEGNFELETRVKFTPVGDFQLAGLLIYESAANFVQFGRAFCDFQQCANDGFYQDMYIGGTILPENFAIPAFATDTVYLRLRREGNKYTSYASENGTDWKLVGSHTSEMKPLFVGLVAGQAYSAPQVAQFDYFLINSLP